MKNGEYFFSIPITPQTICQIGRGTWGVRGHILYQTYETLGRGGGSRKHTKNYLPIFWLDFGFLKFPGIRKLDTALSEEIAN